jgi:NhaP-type Na+/H+ or K+/H+ antiporter
MLLTGMTFGPNGFRSFLDLTHYSFELPKIPDLILEHGPELRNFALIIILIRAGLGLKKKDLITVGGPALRLSFIPASCEAIAIMIIATTLLEFSILESALLAFVIAAVSPAVIVPKMLSLMEAPQHRKVATLILAAASLDDVFVIAAFGICMKAAQPLGTIDSLAIISFPIYLFIGLLSGAAIGYLLAKFIKKGQFNPAQGCLLTLIFALVYKENEQNSPIPFCSLLGVMALSFMLKETQLDISQKLSQHFQSLWVGAELLLFLLIGAAVDLKVLVHLGVLGFILVIGGLCARSIGVWISLRKSTFSKPEQWFVTLSMLPKATVQAAIGGSVLVALTEGSAVLGGGTETGEQILACAVLAILVTAPLGALAIDWGLKRLLHPRSSTHTPHV